MRLTCWVLLLFVVAGALLLASCANPVAPTGGPRDRTPPSIVETDPVRDTVNVSTDTRSLYIEFSEYVERSSFEQSLSITPRFDERIRFDWSGQGVSIELPRALRDSTTYIFSFSTELTDAHGVSLEDPITVAFSTGPRINQGQINGRVVRPASAQPQARVDVFAYAVSNVRDSRSQLPERPAYRTQTGSDGSFTFDYMREQDYFVIALRDNNRNLRPDRPEPFAMPPRRTIPADRDSTEIPVPWLITLADTTRPQLQRAESLSQKRVQIIFSEPIQITSREPDAWALQDSVSGSSVRVRSVYRSTNRRDGVVLRTAEMDSTRHTLALTPDLVADTLGQDLRPDTAHFRAVSRPDTTRTRFRTFIPQELSSDTADTYRLLPGLQPGVRLNQTPDSSTLEAVLSLQDTTGQSRSFDYVTDDGRTFRIRPHPPLRPDEIVDLSVDLTPITGIDTTYRRRFRRVTDEVLGALEGRAILTDTTYSTTPSSARVRADLSSDSLAGSDTSAMDGAVEQPSDSVQAGPIVVEILPEETSIAYETEQQSVEPGSTFVFTELPEGSFQFRAFHDRNRNGRWDGGLIRPYEPAEPITWSEGATDSRPRWTSVISRPLRVPVLRITRSPAPTPAADTTVMDSISTPMPDTTATDSIPNPGGGGP